MESISIQLNRKKLHQVIELAIVQNLDRHFKVVDDSEDKYKNIRFITIEGKDLQLDLNGENIKIRYVSKPNQSVGIYRGFVVAVEVVL